MEFKLYYKGRNVIAADNYCDMYRLNMLSVGVSRSKYSIKLNKHLGSGKDALTISFGCHTAPPTKEEVEYVFSQFNFDSTKQHYRFIKRKPTYDIIYYEQIQDAPPAQRSDRQCAAGIQH